MKPAHRPMNNSIGRQPQTAQRLRCSGAEVDKLCSSPCLGGSGERRPTRRLDRFDGVLCFLQAQTSLLTIELDRLDLLVLQQQFVDLDRDRRRIRRVADVARSLSSGVSPRSIASTASLASFKPRPVCSRTNLIASIFLPSRTQLPDADRHRRRARPVDSLTDRSARSPP